jgi:hypothetical protein
VGTADVALCTRVAVLQQAHFDAMGCTAEDVPEVMAVGTFDIVLLSADVAGTQVAELHDKFRGSVVISLEPFTAPAELLERVERVETLHSCGTEASKAKDRPFLVN